MDARRAPEGVGEGHGADELGDLQNRRADDRFDRVATSSSRTRGSPAGASESRSAAERHGALRATVPTTARATSRRRGRGDRPEVAWSGGGAGRAAVAALGSQERGRCGPSAQRAEWPAERIRGTLLRRLARPATYVQSVATDILANDRRNTDVQPYRGRNRPSDRRLPVR